VKSTRQGLHARIAQVLEALFPPPAAAEPEVVAHHYTAAGLGVQAIPYWQQAGQRALERSANREAISHLTKGLEVLDTLPDTLERTQQELDLQTMLGPALTVTKGYGAPEVEQTYTRARELSRQVGETPQLFPVQWGLWVYYLVRSELETACELGEQCLTLAQRVQDPVFLVAAHDIVGLNLLHRGELVSARGHLEQSMALYDPQQHRSYLLLFGHDYGCLCLSWLAMALWFLGYPDQALK